MKNTIFVRRMGGKQYNEEYSYSDFKRNKDRLKQEGHSAKDSRVRRWSRERKRKSRWSR